VPRVFRSVSADSGRARRQAGGDEGRLDLVQRIRGGPRVRRIDGHVDADRAGAFPHPGLGQIHHVGALRGGKATASAADEYHDRAVGFLHRDRMALPIIFRRERGGRDDVVAVFAGAERHRKPDQRRRQIKRALAIGGLSGCPL
jgi:hypothetical protein